LFWGLQQLQAYVLTIPSEQTLRIEWVSLPTWAGSPAYGPVLGEVEAAAGLHLNDDIHDADLARRVAENLLASPWIAAVARVAKRPDGTLLVNATFREPLAYVDVRGRAYLIDTAGVRLPVECDADYIEPGQWLLVQGVRGAIPPVGERWSGEDLVAGIELVKYLRLAASRNEIPFNAALRAVDVANFDRRERRPDAPLRIRTVYPNCYVNWGEPPGQEYPIEPSAQRKIDMLRALYVELGQFPDRVLDVRGEDVIRAGPVGV
jgi:hypothetical protein